MSPRNEGRGMRIYGGEDPMTERHFIVSERDHVWQYSFRGSVAGPFKSREDAIDAAIEEAGQAGDPQIAVIVQDHDMQQETVWRHPVSDAPAAG